MDSRTITFLRTSEGRRPATPSSLAGSEAVGDRLRRPTSLLALGGLFALSLVLAVQIYAHYLQTARSQWHALGHDRNAHLLQGMFFAVDVRTVDLESLFRDLNRMRGWPPLFSLLAAPVLVAGDFDFRLVALVSLTGWIGTVVLVFLLTREVAPSHRDLAALVAALFALGSPAYRTYATDIMVESLGACVSLLVLYLYVLNRGTPASTRTTTLLGVSLTALFFLKYNYWFLTVVDLVVAESIMRYPEIRERLYGLWARGEVRRVLVGELRRPIGWALVAIVGVAGLLLITGERQFTWGGHRIKIGPTLNLAYACFVLLSIRLATIWWQHRHRLRDILGDRALQLFRWHLLPLTIWLLWPRKLQSLLRVVGPTNAYEFQLTEYWRWTTLLFYPRAIATEYHDSLWAAVVAGSLALFAFTRVARLKADARLILLFLALSAILTTAHTNHQSRYIHTWIMLLWVAAGIGFASISALLSRARPFGVLIASITLGAIIAVPAIKPVALALTGRGEVPVRPQVETALDLSDYYLPRIGCYRHVAIFSTVPSYHFATWSYLQQYPDRRASLTVGLKRFSRSIEANRSEFADWLQRTPADAVVFIDIPEGTFFYYADWPGEELHQQYRALIQSQTLFREVDRQAFPQYQSTVSILVRNEAGTSQTLCQETKGDG